MLKYHLTSFRILYRKGIRRILIVFLPVLFVICGNPLLAQKIGLDLNKKLSQYVLRSWSTQDGLASESTNEILQSDDGYIWIATYAGLHRFDGKDFTVFNAQNSNIPSPNVLCVKEGLNGEIWLGTLHGIAIFNSGDFIVPTGLEAISEMNIEEMLVTKQGSLWISTKSNHLFYYNDGVLKEFTDEFNLNESTVLTIIEDSSGKIYFGTDDSRFISYSTDGTIANLPLDPSTNGVNTFFSQGTTIYLGTGRGLYLWDGNQVSKLPILTNTAVTTLHMADNSVLWIGTMSGLYRWNSSSLKLDSLTESNGMPNNIVRSMTFDMEGNLWVATYRNGIFFLADGSMTSFTTNDGLATNIISNVTEISQNTFLLGNENGVLNLLKNDEVSVWNPPIPLSNARLKHLFTDSKGKVWVSTYGGLFVLDGKNSRKFTINEGFPDNFIRVAFEDHSGTIWVGTKNAGLIRFTSLDKWEQLNIEDGLSSNYIMSIEENEAHQLIVGTINGLNIIEDNKLIKTVTVEDGLPSNFMFSTLSTPSYIWISSNDGLTGYSEEKIVNFNSENGLSADIIYDIKRDENGNFWLPSENSILSVNIDNLERAAENPSIELNVKQYDKSYGMKNSHCLGAVLSFNDSNGRFWIPTLGGIVRVNPKDITAPVFQPKLIIENVYADNVKLPKSGTITVPPGTDRLLIDFTGISYVQADRLQFRYRLNPFDKEWINASPERNGIYTNLSPGEYEFQLQVGIDNIFMNESLNLQLNIEASWWQTTWAKVTFGVGLLLIALLIYWVRLRALTSRNVRLEATVSERTKALELQKQELNNAINQLKSAQEQMIQSDKMASLGILAAGVAHEINNPLNFIQGGVDGLEQTLAHNESIKQEEYATLLGAIKEGISRASTIVSSLNEFSHSADNKPEPCNIHHLIDNCLTMIRYQLKQGIELVKEFTDGEVMVMGNNGKIHQVFLNIITNAIQAIEKKGQIKIKTTCDKDKVIIDFTDTGQGIKPEHLSKITEPFFSTKDPGKGTGLGLSITYSIIAEHKGTLNYSSIWGKGTTARVTFPLLKTP